MNDHNCLVVLFNSTHQALSGEKALEEAGIKHSVINTPREFSVDCGISLRIDCELAGAAQKALDAADVIYAGVEPYRSRWV
ncbi:MAG: DUF3343 domain-containing protein [Actinomycetota bacterium]|nr:DUF3343 domain-containing protein [Actinomycetota bacterium]MDD5666847.1 DUF3343 domain-containing protein [Actinomycetota bacterium]